MVDILLSDIAACLLATASTQASSVHFNKTENVDVENRQVVVTASSRASSSETGFVSTGLRKNRPILARFTSRPRATQSRKQRNTLISAVLVLF
jgi:hypothetical protein